MTMAEMIANTVRGIDDHERIELTKKIDEYVESERKEERERLVNLLDDCGDYIVNHTDWTGAEKSRARANLLARLIAECPHQAGDAG